MKKTFSFLLVIITFISIGIDIIVDADLTYLISHSLLFVFLTSLYYVQKDLIKNTFFNNDVDLIEELLMWSSFTAYVCLVILLGTEYLLFFSNVDGLLPLLIVIPTFDWIYIISLILFLIYFFRKKVLINSGCDLLLNCIFCLIIIFCSGL